MEGSSFKIKENKRLHLLNDFIKSIKLPNGGEDCCTLDINMKISLKTSRNLIRHKEQILEWTNGFGTISSPKDPISWMEMPQGGLVNM